MLSGGLGPYFREDLAKTLQTTNTLQYEETGNAKGESNMIF
jgi:hypothetical protein